MSETNKAKSVVNQNAITMEKAGVVARPYPLPVGGVANAIFKPVTLTQLPK